MQYDGDRDYLAYKIKYSSDPILKLYAIYYQTRRYYMDTRWHREAPPVLDHSLSYLLRAKTVEELLHVISTYNEPFAHVLLFERTDNYASLWPAVEMDEPIAMIQLLTADPPLPIATRTNLWLHYIDCDDFNEACRDLRFAYCDRPSVDLRDNIRLRFLTGRLVVYAKAQGSGRLYRECASTYTFQIQSCRAAVRTAYWCLRRKLGMCRDVATMIVKLLWNTREECLYEPRRSERIKRQKK